MPLTLLKNFRFWRELRPRLHSPLLLLPHRWRISVFEGNYDGILVVKQRTVTQVEEFPFLKGITTRVVCQPTQHFRELKNFRFWRELRHKLASTLRMQDKRKPLKNFRFWRELRPSKNNPNILHLHFLCWRISVFEGNYDFYRELFVVMKAHDNRWRISVFEGNYDCHASAHSLLKSENCWRISVFEGNYDYVFQSMPFSGADICWRISVFEGNYDYVSIGSYPSTFSLVEEFPFLKGITTIQSNPH